MSRNKEGQSREEGGLESGQKGVESGRDRRRESGNVE